MMTKVKYQKHQKRIERAKVFWSQVVKEYNKGKTAQEIAQNYINPATGKHYTRAHIYWILQKMRDL